jgi:outer membrane immunogenic protein
MKLIELTLVSGLLAAGATPALAADLIIAEKPPSLSAAHDWSGVYVGGHLGYVQGPAAPGEEGSSGALLVAALAATDEGAIDASGFLIGLQTGANWQMEAIVLGLEGQIGYFGASGEQDDLTVDFGAYADITARIGIAADTALFYLKGGWALAQLDVTDSMGAASFSGVKAGWTVGSGAELALDENWSAKAEYQYYDFGDKDPAEPEFGAHTLKIGLNYAF